MTEPQRIMIVIDPNINMAATAASLMAQAFAKTLSRRPTTTEALYKIAITNKPLARRLHKIIYGSRTNTIRGDNY